MLFLLFQLGRDRYAIEAARVVEVVPLLELKKIPHAPNGFAGIFVYRGQPVPAIDLCQVTLGWPARERLSTRIIVTHCADSRGRPRLLGLIAEHVTGTLRRNSDDFTEADFGDGPRFGPVLLDPKGTIQWVHERHLITDQLRELLFLESPAGGSASLPGLEFPKTQDARLKTQDSTPA